MGKWIMGCDCDDLEIPDKKDRNHSVPCGVLADPPQEPNGMV
jgi:hypothetical protein